MKGLSALQKYITKTGRYAKENPRDALTMAGLGGLAGLSGTGAIMGMGKTDHDIWREDMERMIRMYPDKEREIRRAYAKDEP